MMAMYVKTLKEVRRIKKLFVTLALLTILLGGQVKANQPEFYESSNTFIVYGYCSCNYCCGKEDKLTFTEVKALEGRTIAVDPSIIPIGSTVLIYYEDELVGIFQAEDIGGDIKGNVIDMYFENHLDALDWGKKNCEVIVVDAKG